jgi:hypothetical protein
LKRNNFEEFNFGTTTTQHNPLTGSLLSPKESAKHTVSIFAFSSEDAGNSAFKTTSISTPSLSQVYRKFVRNIYIILPEVI